MRSQTKKAWEPLVYRQWRWHGDAVIFTGSGQDGADQRDSKGGAVWR